MKDMESAQRDCKDSHDIDFSKRGVCMYEYQRAGSCKRGQHCWFLHDIPRWYRSSQEIEKQMKEKSIRMKRKTRVMTNQRETPPVWQPNNSTPNISAGITSRSSVSSFVSPFRSNQQDQNNFSNDFLEV